MASGESWSPGLLRPMPQGATSGTATTMDRVTGSIIARIECILESVLDNLSQACEAGIELKSRRTLRKRVSQGSTLSSNHVCFPGKNQQEARKFGRRNVCDQARFLLTFRLHLARILLILQLSHDALVSGTVLTKRHIYYQHQELFGKQQNVDDLVDDLALTLAVSRDDLNIVAAAKGVVSGPVAMVMRNGSRLDAQGTTIPESRSIKSIELQNVKWVLVVEKEAVFRSLSACQFWQTSAAGPGLLVTAKGYPDMVTLSFLRLLQHTHPQLPMYGLVDFDPDGVNIFRCYRYGSEAYGVGSDDLHIHRLGIKASHVTQMKPTDLYVPSQLNEEERSSQSSTRSTTSRAPASSTTSRDPYSQLTCRDRKLAAATLERLSTRPALDHEVDALKDELQTILMLGMKVEIEWVDEAGSITDWLDFELETNLSRDG
ncbi:Meiotic recombination protein rec12 [Paramyrothecium foliicola]|nr:Meiotic recombination protein rec12 [Paramyrothecium foliicola]